MAYAKLTRLILFDEIVSCSNDSKVIIGGKSDRFHLLQKIILGSHELNCFNFLARQLLNELFVLATRVKSKLRQI